METIITIKGVEAEDIIKKHALEAIAMDVSNKDINVFSSYGEFTVEITDKKHESEDEEIKQG